MKNKIHITLLFIFSMGFAFSINPFSIVAHSVEKKSFSAHYLNLSPFITVKNTQENDNILLITFQFASEEIIARYNLKNQLIEHFLWKGITLKPNKNSKNPWILFKDKNLKIYFQLPEIFQIKQVILNGLQLKVDYRINQDIAQQVFDLYIEDPQDYRSFLNVDGLEQEENNNLQDNTIYLYVHQPEKSLSPEGFVYEVDKIKLNITETNQEKKENTQENNILEEMTNGVMDYYPRKKIPLPPLYKVHEDSQNNVISLKYYTYHLDKPTLTVQYDKKNRKILNYAVMENGKVIFTDNVEKNPNLSFDYYPKSFELEPNSFFFNEIIPKITEQIKSLTGSEKWEKISTIISEVKLLNTDRINLMNIINNHLTKHPNFLNNSENLVIIIPIKYLVEREPENHYHVFFLYFIFKKVGQYFILQKIMETNSQINGYVLMNTKMQNLIKQIISPYREPRIGANPNNKINLIASPIYLGNNRRNLIQCYQTQQGGSFCCYTAVYKDLCKILYYLPDIVQNRSNPFTKRFLKTKDLGIGGHMLENESKFDALSFKNKFSQFLVSALTQHSLNGIGSTILLLLEVNGVKDLGALENEHLLKNQEIVNIMRSRYVIYFYVNTKQEIFIYVVQRGNKVDVKYAKFTEIIINQAKSHIGNNKEIKVMAITEKTWKIKKHKMDRNLERARFLAQKNFVESYTLAKIKEDNCHRIQGDNQLETYPYYIFNILENKSKQIVNNAAEDCFFHILFQLSQMENTNKTLLQRIINLLIR